MAFAQERYLDTGPLARWRRPEASPIEVFSAQTLASRHLHTIFKQASRKVQVECSHQKSEWGQFEGSDAWALYVLLSFRGQEKLPRWATLTIKINPVLPETTEGTETRIAGGAGVRAGEHADEADLAIQLPCLTTHIYPKELVGGVPLSLAKSKGITFSPSGGAAGITVALGSVNYSKTRTYAKVLDGLWVVNAETTRVDESIYHRQASWRLEAIGKGKIIPDQLKVGAIIQHDKNTPFHLTVAIDGVIHERLFGDYKFSGRTNVLTVKMVRAQQIAAVEDFGAWAAKMKDHMIELGLFPVPKADTEELHEIR
ncbi:aureobasidin resistance protein Aur1 [Purpureocillium lavendulum]|uniref:Aureobasidin resistance protein Aur1 n=1 Tax=Purpureocillium lavendulum TaxID=1247861 RepID=A0AB34FLB9_9HYPO|nr:aureobasidin resistance protein Aur1 [Purpureocillium lavendulum]